MRKPKIPALLVITILFVVFLIGFFLGRNQNSREIVLSSLPKEFVTEPSVFSETDSSQAEETVIITFPISINQADKAEFMALPGIGEVLAQRIVDYRDKNGSFSSPEELLNVEGIGERRLEEIIDMITIGG